MSEIVSSTTRFIPRKNKTDEFLMKAHVLVAQAESFRAEDDLTQALESAYRAALRTAGAVIASSPVASRKRKPTGAWQQLEMVGSHGARWSRLFSNYSKLRSRVISGFHVTLTPGVVDQLISMVQDFLATVEADVDQLPEVA